MSISKTVKELAMMGIKKIKPVAYSSPGAFNRATHFSHGYWFVGEDKISGVQFYRSGSNIYLSSDYGTTLTSAKGFPANVTNLFTIVKIVRAFNLWWCMALDSVDGLYHLYSCSPVTGNGSLTWVSRLTLASGTTGNIAGCLNASSDGNTLCVSEYSTTTTVPPTTGGVSIYRTVDGTTFTRVFQHPTGRHFHGVYEDNYYPGTWYALLGDGTTTPMLRSTDNAATFSAVATVTQGWDGIAMSFSPNYIWCTGDVYNAVAPVAPVYVLDRSKMTPLAACKNSPRTIPVFNSGVYEKGTVTSGSNTLTMSFSRNIPLTPDDAGLPILIKKQQMGHCCLAEQ